MNNIIDIYNKLVDDVQNGKREIVIRTTKRRVGKTQALIQFANHMAFQGYQVLYLTNATEIVKLRKYLPLKNSVLFSYESLTHLGIPGYKFDFVILDDREPSEMPCGFDNAIKIFAYTKQYTYHVLMPKSSVISLVCDSCRDNKLFVQNLIDTELTCEELEMYTTSRLQCGRCGASYPIESYIIKDDKIVQIELSDKKFFGE